MNLDPILYIHCGLSTQFSKEKLSAQLNNQTDAGAILNCIIGFSMRCSEKREMKIENGYVSW
jgi:hypothetical protein